MLHEKYPFLKGLSLNLQPELFGFISSLALPIWIIIFVMFSRTLSKQKKLDIKNYNKHTKITELLLSIEDLVEKHHNIEILYPEVSRIIINEGGFELVWFGKYDPKSDSIIPINSLGERRIYLNELTHSCSKENTSSPVSDAYNNVETVIVNNLFKSKYSKFFKTSKEAKSFRSTASFVTHNGFSEKIIMSVYSTESNMFDNYHAGLFERIAELLNKAFQNSLKDETLEELLHKSQISSAVFKINEPLLIADSSMKFIQVNSSVCDMLGYTEEELIGERPALFHPDIEDKDFFETLLSSLHAHHFWSGRMTVITKDKAKLTKNVTIFAIIENGTIIHFVTRYQDIKPLDKDGQELAFKAYHDPLTKLPNRSLLTDRLKQTFSANKRTNVLGALLFIDLDNFKHINDSFGHDAGDYLLVQVTERLKDTLREEDTIARLGGDEFVVLLPSLGLDRKEVAKKATLISKNVLASLSKKYEYNTIDMHTTPSIGITLFPDIAKTPEDVIKQGDTSMYLAKQEGKNTIHFYDDTLDKEIQRNRKMEMNMRHALLSGEFSLFFQPKIDTEHRKIIGAEALLRWIHPIKGNILPSKFLPILQHSNLQNAVNEWVLEQACKQISIWEEEKLLDASTVIGVNMTTIQFKQRDFVQKIKNIIEKYDIDAHHLEFELLESTMIDDYHDVTQKVNELKEIGISFSIDDFGTGYSSLTHLKDLPLNQLIIARDFVYDIETNESSKTIVDTIITMAHNLGIQVTAKGVENKQQLRILHELGCDNYQGYYLSEAINAKEYIKFHNSHSSHF
jgi:diguanylate cyclase (GGDEF)-like protein/PAS domain S-box-containing protein